MSAEFDETLAHIRDSLKDLPDWDRKGEPYLQAFAEWAWDWTTQEEIAHLIDYLRSRSLEYLLSRFDYCSTMKVAFRNGWSSVEEKKRSRY